MKRLRRREKETAGSAYFLIGRKTICLISIVILFFATVHHSESAVVADDVTPAELKDLSLAELMDIEVTTVSKHPEKLAETAAAITVITPEDIRRSGATSIPDLLRLAPGFNVARIDNHRYAVSARGFNGEFASKLLVMIDGRSIYTPLFNGVFWDRRDVMLEDIERIEAIRGPGCALWGANAVNGIVNIITKSAKDTQGSLMSVGGGTEERWFGSFRHGAKAGENVYFRIYGKGFERDDLAGGDLADNWRFGQGGFRLDWVPSETDTLTFEGDFHYGNASETVRLATTVPPAFAQVQNNDIHYRGGNLLGRWTHHWSDESESEFQAFFDGTKRDSLGKEERYTGDIEFQHRLLLGERNEITGGIGYHVSADRFEPSIVSFVPPERTLQYFNVFVQDEIMLLPEKLHLTLGSKFERNDYTGFETQPNARLAWMPRPQHTVWGTVARSVRTPARFERDVDALFQPITVPGVPSPVVVHGTGNPDFESATVMTYEMGYRYRMRERMTADLVGFYNEYDRLRSLEPGTLDLISTPPVLNGTLDNGVRAESYGVELALQFQINDWWSLRPSYAYLEIQAHAASSQSADEIEAEGSSPRHQFSARSLMNFGRRWELDCWLRYVDQLPFLNIPSYLTMDVRLAWHPKANLELALIGQNLFDNQHPEFFENRFGVPGQPAEVERGVYAKVTWRF